MEAMPNEESADEGLSRGDEEPGGTAAEGEVLNLAAETAEATAQPQLEETEPPAEGAAHGAEEPGGEPPLEETEPPAEGAAHGAEEPGGEPPVEETEPPAEGAAHGAEEPGGEPPWEEPPTPAAVGPETELAVEGTPHGAEDPGAEADEGAALHPPAFEDPHYEESIFDDDAMSDTMEVVDHEALFAERVSELLLPNAHSILRGSCGGCAVCSGGLCKVDESPLANDSSAAAGDDAQQETGEGEDTYHLTVDQILQTSSNDQPEEHLDQKFLEENNADENSANPEGLDQKDMGETNVDHTSTNLEGLDPEALGETNVDQTSTNLEGLDQEDVGEAPEGLDQQDAEEESSSHQAAEDGFLDCQYGGDEDMFEEGDVAAEPLAEGESPDLCEDELTLNASDVEEAVEDGEAVEDDNSIVDATEGASPTAESQAEDLIDSAEHIIDVTSDGDPCGSADDEASHHRDAVLNKMGSSSVDGLSSPAAQVVDLDRGSDADASLPVGKGAQSEVPGHPDQLPALVGPDGQPLRGPVKVQGQASHPRRPPIDNSRKGWGTSWSPGFPTEAQLARKVDSMLRDHAETRFRSENRAAASKPGKEKSREGISRIREASPADSRAGRAQSATARVSNRPKAPQKASTSGSMSATMLPSLGTSSSSQSVAKAERKPLKKKYDPARMVHEDGRVTLRGVRSTSDLEKYAKGVDFQSRKGIEVRAAFKTMRSTQHSAVVQETWSALYSLQASERGFDDWYASAKDGARYRFRL